MERRTFAEDKVHAHEDEVIRHEVVLDFGLVQAEERICIEMTHEEKRCETDDTVYGCSVSTGRARTLTCIPSQSSSADSVDDQRVHGGVISAIVRVQNEVGGSDSRAVRTCDSLYAGAAGSNTMPAQ